MVDDVADLVRVQPVIDRHQDPAVSADAEIGDQEPGCVRADDRDALAVVDAQGVQRERHAARPALQLPVGQRAQRSGSSRLVEDGVAVPVNRGAAAEVVPDVSGTFMNGLPGTVDVSAFIPAQPSLAATPLIPAGAAAAHPRLSAACSTRRAGIGVRREIAGLAACRSAMMGPWTCR